jgi:hypothetical protein
MLLQNLMLLRVYLRERQTKHTKNEMKWWEINFKMVVRLIYLRLKFMEFSNYFETANGPHSNERCSVRLDFFFF